MNIIAALIFSTLFFGGLSINKYVLSVLGFRYPTIFQGWQTLAGLVIYKLLNLFWKPEFNLTPVDKSGIISLLPGLLFHTTSLISNSKALAELPISVFIALQNTLPAGIYLLDRVKPGSRPPTATLQGACAVLTFITGVILVLGETSLDFQESGYFWLIIGVMCNGASILHSRIADARFSSWDRLYYSALSSVIILAPASLYLEEAFMALKFRHDRQELFLAGCVFSAVFMAAFNLYSVRLKEDEYFGLLQNSASGITAVSSVFLFTDDLQLWQWIIIGINLVSSIPLPAHQNKDEDDQQVGFIQSA